MKKSNSKRGPHLWVVLFLLGAGLVLTQCMSSRIKVEEPEAMNDRWALWTGGTQLRGANVWQKRIDPAIDGDGLGTEKVGPPYPVDDLNHLAELGANWVNLSYPGLFTESPPYVVDPAVEKHLEEWLANAAKAKLYVTLSFRTGPGRNEAIFDESEKGRAIQTVWSDPKAQDAWVEMWRYTAKRYGNHPVVAGFHLMVEPNANRAIVPPIDDAVIFHAKYRGKRQDWNGLAERLIAAIRDENGSVPILVGGLNYSSLEWAKVLELPQVPRLVTNVHFYEPYPYSHKEVKLAYPLARASEVTGGEAWDRAWLKKRLSELEAVKEKRGTPVSIGEFGVIRHQAGASQYLDDLSGLFEERGVNYAVWLWESSFKKISYDSFNFRRGTKEGNRTDVKNNELIQVLRKRWSKNAVRPSVKNSDK